MTGNDEQRLEQWITEMELPTSGTWIHLKGIIHSELTNTWGDVKHADERDLNLGTKAQKSLCTYLRRLPSQILQYFY